jgi:hypothetical protein
MNRRLIIFIAVVIVSLAGWTFLAVQSFLTKQTTKAEIQKAFPADSHPVFMNADKLTLYSLKPEKQTNSAESFHDYVVLGKTEIDTLKHQLELKTAFVAAMAGANSGGCINPRHGLRAESKGRTIDLVISFECQKFMVYSGDQTGEAGINPANLEDPFNQILQNAGVATGK